MSCMGIESRQLRTEIVQTDRSVACARSQYIILSSQYSAIERSSLYV